jgi:hypothetical protein
VQRLTRLSAASLAPVGLGLVFGVAFVLTSAYRDAPLWWVWAPLAVALTTAAGAVFLYGLNRWAELARLLKQPTSRVRNALPRVTTVAVLTVLGLLGSTLYSGPARSGWRAVVLLAFTIVGGVPALGVMEAIRHAADHHPTPGTKGEQVALLVRMRQLLQRLLPAVGSLVALSTLATGAVLALQRSLPAGSGDSGTTQQPPQSVLIFGGVGSLLVALFYMPAATALQRRGRRLCDALFPLEEADETSVILSLAEDRGKLEQLLGIDRGVVADLQTGLTILGPLLASAAAAFLSP